MIKNSVTALLIADATMAGYVSNRIFPVYAPQETELPFVVVQKNTQVGSDFKDGVSNMDTADFQVDVYAETELSAQNIASRVRALLDRHEDLTTGGEIQSIAFVQEADASFEFDAEIFAKSLDFRARVVR